jgi:hypothetical protein
MLSPPKLPRAVLADGQIELWLEGGRTVRLPVPPGGFRKTLWTGDRLFVLGRELLGIDLRSLPNAPEAGLTLATVASASAADLPARVTFAGASAIITVRHPLYGDTRVTRTPTSPQVKVGDRLILEGITPLPGGVMKVDSWRLAESETSAPPELALGEELLPPQGPVGLQIGDEALLFGEAEMEEAPPQLPPLAPLVEPIERLFGGGPIPLLRTLVHACDASPATRARWDGMGPAFTLAAYEPEVEVQGLEKLAFTPFAAEGDRIFYGVVRNPRGPGQGIAVLNAEGDHSFYWSADTFEGWLASVLADSFPESRVKLLLEDLALPESFLKGPVASAPAWFTEQVEPS